MPRSGMVIRYDGELIDPLFHRVQCREHPGGRRASSLSPAGGVFENDYTSPDFLHEFSWTKEERR